ncbi:MAG: hypothetical protein L3J63_04660 [Geopsychrobacter sp.]|nr:hypothetical protein [Geopsychrobacter sp.]
MMTSVKRIFTGAEMVERIIWLRWLERLICLTVIIIALAIGLSSYQKIHKRTLVLATVGPFDVAKVDSLLYWNMHGTWPQNTLEARGFIGLKRDYPDRNYKTGIEEGTVQVEALRGPLTGEWVSYHPVTPAADTTGPVHWRIGLFKPDKKLYVQGPDKTTLAQEDIPLLLQ